jgi:hypothetical protein
MPGPVVRRATLVSFLLLCAAVESPPPARFAPDAPPQTMQGVYRYKVRGLTAGGGVFIGMMAAQGMYVATVHRMLPGFFKILGGMAKFSKDPSTAEVLDFLRSGTPGVDLSNIPISAGLDIEIEFTLEKVKKDEWQLKRGSYRWSSDANFRFSAGEGQIKENVRGQGSGTLDPKISSISLVTTGKRDSRRSELTGSVQMSGQGGGNSVVTNGPVKISFDYRGDKVIMEVNLPGLAHHREALGGGLWEREFPFSKSGPPERLVKGRETYQDLLDSQVVEEWELWPECGAQIESPVDNDELVYNEKNPGQLVDTALAEVQPSFWEDDLHWLLPEISGSELEPRRQKANGNDFDVVYTNLPEKNSEFRKTKVIAYFDTDRAKRAGCKDPEPIEVGYFFPREGLNHGGPPGPKFAVPADLPNPNWFHYWMQTKANVGLATDFVRFGGQYRPCPDSAHAYYMYGQRFVVVCDLGSGIGGFVGYNALAPGYYPEGIDWFASILLHEKQHHDNYWRWWSKGYDEILDTDGDDIPDLLEHTVPVPPIVRSKTHRTKFSPKAYDSFGYKINDEHYLAWAAGLNWDIGSADNEDWSCPGAQTKKCGQ